MSLTINIYYTGKNGAAKKYAEEMKSSGIIGKVRAEDGNEKYEFFYPIGDAETVLLIDKWADENALDMHHKSDIMKEIAKLRDKYGLRMRVERFSEITE